MSTIARRIAKATAVVIAIGGFLAAYSVLRNDVQTVTHPDKVVHTTPAAPVLPPYKTDWVTGTGGGDQYCRPRLAAYQAQYPNFTISAYEPPGEHMSYWNPFKQDRYRFSCIFSATPKVKSG